MRSSKVDTTINFSKILILFSFVALIAVWSDTTFGQVSSANNKSVVKGIVTDPTDGRVARAKLVIENKKGKQAFRANDAGEYEIVMPAGVYTIFAEMEGFYPSSRKKIRLTSNRAIRLNFVLKGIRNDVDHP
jgi:hypothetical protein